MQMSWSVCSLHSNSQLDMNIKGTMVKDLLNLAGFMLPEKNDIRDTSSHHDMWVMTSAQANRNIAESIFVCVSRNCTYNLYKVECDCIRLLRWIFYESLCLLSGNKYVLPADICMDKRLWPNTVAPDERVKHAYYTQRHSEEVSRHATHMCTLQWMIDTFIRDVNVYIDDVRVQNVTSVRKSVALFWTTVHQTHPPKLRWASCLFGFFRLG